jgi:glycerophosphoryl diester phosphodiesterase
MPMSEPDAGDAADMSPAASKPLIVAHRGSSSSVAEHTVGAYRLAIAEGADALECDVRLSADGELVCLHDRTLERTGGSNGIVSAMTLAELRAVDWGAWKHASDSDRDPESAALVTLRELVELALDAVETKHPSRAGGRVEHAVAELLEEYGLAGGRRPGQVWARMMSFSGMAVRRMASLCPELPLVLLVSAQQPLPVRRPRLAAGAGTAGVDLALVRERPSVVAERHEAGNEVWVWTVDDEDDMGLCLRLGVDAIITNRPSAALDLIARNR